MRETEGFSVSPLEMLRMLSPRLLNSSAISASTPLRLATRAEMVCFTASAPWLAALWPERCLQATEAYI